MGHGDDAPRTCRGLEKVDGRGSLRRAAAVDDFNLKSIPENIENLSINVNMKPKSNFLDFFEKWSR